MKQVIEGKLYDTETARKLGDDRYWDGHSFERDGRNKYLYKTKRGRYFVKHTTLWEGETDYLEPLTIEQAKTMWEEFDRRGNLYASYKEAFGEEPEEA